MPAQSVFSLCAMLLALGSAPLPAQTLRELAAQRGIRIGAAVEPALLAEEVYASTLSREFNQLAAENVMKFETVHPSPETYNFGPADQLSAFARQNHMAVRGHTLVWYRQNPSWLTEGNFTPAKLASILRDHIQTVVGHFAGQVYAWDVVNEAFNDDGSLRSFLWSDAPGIEAPGTFYLELALRWAHAADPQALLFYNDYNAETVNPKSDAIYRMAQAFVERGVPIHGIGLQMHLTTSPVSLAAMEANLKRITALGLQVQITELDVRLPMDASGATTAANRTAQAKIYHDVIALCLKYPLCTAIQTWGFTDRYSWIPAAFPGTGAALEFDPAYHPKPAYGAMQDALRSPRPAPPVRKPKE